MAELYDIPALLSLNLTCFVHVKRASFLWKWPQQRNFTVKLIFTCSPLSTPLPVNLFFFIPTKENFCWMHFPIKKAILKKMFVLSVILFFICVEILSRFSTTIGEKHDFLYFLRIILFQFIKGKTKKWK